jgi:hypothetical protein
MTKTRARKTKPATISDDILELVPTVPHEVPETTRLIRLTPIENDLSVATRQVAIVAAETEDHARELASAYDPFGRDWKNEKLFAAESFNDTDAHVIGDVIFKSTPLSRPRKQKGQEAK